MSSGTLISLAPLPMWIENKVMVVVEDSVEYFHEPHFNLDVVLLFVLVGGGRSSQWTGDIRWSRTAYSPRCDFAISTGSDSGMPTTIMLVVVILNGLLLSFSAPTCR